MKNKRNKILIARHLMARYEVAGKAKVTLKLGEAEIPVLPAHSQTAEELLEALAGCLGQESVQVYDFQLLEIFESW